MFINWHLLAKEIHDDNLRLLIVFSQNPRIKFGLELAYPELFSDTACKKVSVAAIQECMRSYSLNMLYCCAEHEPATLTDEDTQGIAFDVKYWHLNLRFAFWDYMSELYLPLLEFSIEDGIGIPEEIIRQMSGKKYGELIHVIYNSIDCIVTDYLDCEDEPLFSIGETITQKKLSRLTQLKLLPADILDFSASNIEQIVADPGTLTEFESMLEEDFNWAELSTINEDLFTWLCIRLSQKAQPYRQMISRLSVPENFIKYPPDTKIRNRLKIGFPEIFKKNSWRDCDQEIPLSVLQCAAKHAAIMDDWYKPECFGSYNWLFWLYYLTYSPLLVEIAEHVSEISVDFLSPAVKKQINHQICGELIRFTSGGYVYLIVDYDQNCKSIAQLFGKPMKKCWKYLENITILRTDYLDLER